MKNFYINKQTEAEKDQHLFECFHDTGIISDLVDSSFTVVSGRKGSGKTAIARYLERKSEDFGIDLAYRLSVRNFNTLRKGSEKDNLESILFFIIVKTTQWLLAKDYFTGTPKKYWEEFLLKNGLQNISDYDSFYATQKTSRTGLLASVFASWGIASAKGEAKSENESVMQRTPILCTPSALFESLRQSINQKDKIIIFIDDISDYLDESSEKMIRTDINIVKSILFQLQEYNLSFIDSGLSARFVSLVRDDLFEYMEGSNIGKIKSDTLCLEWTEKDFSSLLIRRMPYFQTNLLEALSDPINALKSKFPDEIFTKTLESLGTNRYKSNFYAYMAAISFNRPRDYLQFCFALRDRLSTSEPATFENIESAEIEYCDYFIQELRDELYVASKVFSYDLSHERINLLIDIMSRRENFNSPELKVELGKFLNEKVGHKKVEMFISEMWRYGVIGVRDKKDEVIRFKYLACSVIFTAEKVKQYIYYLHRGLWWFAKKYKGNK
jgi:hypothetical protein